eukprot:scaffold287578_cov52-Prasinocladus_malaysianus.AAC.1
MCSRVRRNVQDGNSAINISCMRSTAPTPKASEVPAVAKRFIMNSLGASIVIVSPATIVQFTSESETAGFYTDMCRRLRHYVNDWPVAAQSATSGSD